MKLSLMVKHILLSQLEISMAIQLMHIVNIKLFLTILIILDSE